jgi:hypothetical protein
VEAVKAGLHSKGLEFATFKSGIMDLLPNSEEFDRIAVPHPVVDK